MTIRPKQAKAPWWLAKNKGKEVAKKRPFLRSISVRRRPLLAAYIRVREEYMRSRPKCERPGCRRKSEELHHRRGRVSSLLCDNRFFCALCHDCHSWVGSNPIEARRLGLLCQPGEWNTPPKDATLE